MEHPKQSSTSIYYVMDPMCSWCYAFRSSWRALLRALEGSVRVRYVMGGLAPDSEAPMPESMRHAIENTWRTIEQHTGANFNYEFWRQNTPRRSTYPACRAAIAAGRLRDDGLPAMVEAIQDAYYLKARNPSDTSVLLDIAESAGFDRAAFAAELAGDEVGAQLAEDFELTRRMGVQGFPAVIGERRAPSGDCRYVLISAGYCAPDELVRRLDLALAELEKG
jgi:putative protein-disulfide isomerase